MLLPERIITVDLQWFMQLEEYLRPDERFTTEAHSDVILRTPMLPGRLLIFRPREEASNG